mmetsp:Transcript_22978/g.58776  ORF Transcript_22978/g.58776 Transcript_22978/m.58776 type:complete len:120 (-) Transcript_22978:1629-1988(-)
MHFTSLGQPGPGNGKCHTPAHLMTQPHARGLPAQPRAQCMQQKVPSPAAPEEGLCCCCTLQLRAAACCTCLQLRVYNSTWSTVTSCTTPASVMTSDWMLRGHWLTTTRSPLTTRPTLFA